MKKASMRFWGLIFLISAKLALAADPRCAPALTEEALAGAHVVKGGVEFKVWAPNASCVYVAGTFNEWQPHLGKLKRNPDGHFSGFVKGAKARDEYKFVIEHHGQFLWRNDPKGLQISAKGNNVIVDQNAYRWRSGKVFVPANEAIIYQIHIGTFTRGHSGNGTLRSAMEKLPYLSRLGINLIQLMPLSQFPGQTSWGYNPSLPFAPAHQYGDPHDLKAFVDQANEYGIGVLFDVVHNHWETYGTTTLHSFDGPNFGKAGIYFYADHRADTQWGLRPDFGRIEVRKFIEENIQLWFTHYRASGLRWDAVSEIRTAAGAHNPDGWELLRSINAQTKSAFPQSLLIAEDPFDYWSVTQPVERGGGGFDSQWDIQFSRSLEHELTKTHDEHRDVRALASLIAQGQYRPSHRILYSESHDEVGDLNNKKRLPNKISPHEPTSYWATKRTTLAAAIVFLSPGIPMIFMGQELFETGAWGDRRPLEWNHRFPGIWQMYHDLIRLRKTIAGLRGPHLNVYHVNDEAKVIAIHRWQNGGRKDDAIVVLNLSGKSYPSYRLGLPTDKHWRVVFNSDSKKYSPLFQSTKAAEVRTDQGPYDRLAYGTTLELPAYSAVVLVSD